MKSIITTYPDFQTLPRGVKRMLLASESHFFDKANASEDQRLEKVPETAPGLHTDVTMPIQSAGHGSQGYAQRDF
jgi:hypothetical protein